MLFQVQISLNKKCRLFLAACAKLTLQAFSFKAKELLRAEMRTGASSKLIWCADDNRRTFSHAIVTESRCVCTLLRALKHTSARVQFSVVTDCVRRAHGQTFSTVAVQQSRLTGAVCGQTRSGQRRLRSEGDRRLIYIPKNNHPISGEPLRVKRTN